MIKFKELKKFIQHFKIFSATNWKDPKRDAGLVVVFKKNMLKKDKQLKRICIMITGDTVEELQKNFDIMSEEYINQVKIFMEEGVMN